MCKSFWWGSSLDYLVCMGVVVLATPFFLFYSFPFCTRFPVVGTPGDCCLFTSVRSRSTAWSFEVQELESVFVVYLVTSTRFSWNTLETFSTLWKLNFCVFNFHFHIFSYQICLLLVFSRPHSYEYSPFYLKLSFCLCFVLPILRSIRVY